MRAQTCECVVTVTDMRMKIWKTSSTFRKVVLVGSSLELHSTWRTKTVVCRENCQDAAAMPTEPSLPRCWSHSLHVCAETGSAHGDASDPDAAVCCKDESFQQPSGSVQHTHTHAHTRQHPMSYTPFLPV